MKKNKFLNLTFLVGLILLLAGKVDAQQHTYGFHADEKAFDGNDLISYFDGSILKGKEDITYQYKEVTLYFANEENRESFKTEP